MKVVVCVEMKETWDIRFAKTCRLPIEPFPDLMIRAHVGNDVLQARVTDINVSTASQMIIVYCTLDEGGGDDWAMDKFQTDRSWKQFGNRTPNENFKDGPSEYDCNEMVLV